MSGKSFKKSPNTDGKNTLTKVWKLANTHPVTVFLFNPQVKTGEAAKFHRKWKGPYEVLERTNKVNYRIRKPSDPRRRSKVVYFNNFKLYQRKQGESTRGQDANLHGQSARWGGK